MIKGLLRWLALLAMALVALQFFFLLRIAVMTTVDPQSTTFQRSQAWHLVHDKGRLRWRQQWVAFEQISNHLKRAVIASEDDGFSQHDGVDWSALEKAWEKNTKADQRATAKTPKVVGGSTITQQLAKNLLLSGERTLLRKGQEFVLTLMLEALLNKQRILEIYLNNVEWGEGVFGAEAAAQHYFKKTAQSLGPFEAARLAVMLPRPRYFEGLPNSPYLSGRAAVIVARMPDARLP